jgi:hypothetical protein
MPQWVAATGQIDALVSLCWQPERYRLGDFLSCSKLLRYSLGTIRPVPAGAAGDAKFGELGRNCGQLTAMVRFNMVQVKRAPAGIKVPAAGIEDDSSTAVLHRLSARIVPV